MADDKMITPTSPQQHGKMTVAAPQISTALANATNVGETAALAMAAKQKALVEARFTLAQHRPRDLDVVREKMLKECRRPSFARSALYVKPIGQGIEGLSIRFVEAAISTMGNLYSDVSVVHDDPDKRILHIEVTDAESNTAHSVDITVTKTVERNSVKEGDDVVRQRMNSKGRTVFIKRATDDEILNTVNNLTSKALRTCGLRLVPGWLRDECLEVIKATLENEDAVDPDAAKRRLFDAFAGLGVSADALKRWLGHDGATLAPAERTALGGIYNAMKDGETTWAEVMDAREANRPGATKPAEEKPASTAKGTVGLKERMAAAKKVIEEPPPETTPPVVERDTATLPLPGTGNKPSDWGLPEADEREPGEEG